MFDTRIEATCAYNPETIALMELNAPKSGDDGGAGRSVANALAAAMQDAGAAQASGQQDA